MFSQELIEYLRESRLLRPLRFARLALKAKFYGHRNWKPLIDADREFWQEADVPGARKRVLVVTSMGGHLALNCVDRLIAAALRLREADVSVVLCDGVLPACQMCEVGMFPKRARFEAHGPAKDICNYCFSPSAKAYQQMELPVVQYSEYLSDKDHALVTDQSDNVNLSNIQEFEWNGLPLGEHALAGALRFFARGQIENEEGRDLVLRRYLRASMLTALAVDRMLDALEPDVMVVHHGIYVPQGIVVAVAKERKIRIVTWNPAYRSGRFIFSHDDTYHRTMMAEPTDVWVEKPLTTKQKEETQKYLKSRWVGSDDWISFQGVPDFEALKGVQSLGLDPEKETFLLLTNVFWDAQIHYPGNAFRTQSEWLEKTISWFSKRPELQLVIRVHPAELTGVPRSRERAAGVIAQYGTLPDNVVVVDAEESTSTYQLAGLCRAAIIFATKTGVELAAMGIPTIVAGEAWVKNKGLSLDAQTQKEYFDLLDLLPTYQPLSQSQRERALKFAHHFFFRRMVPIKAIAPDRNKFLDVGIESIAELQKGMDSGLDLVCDGILEGTPFLFVDEDISASTAKPDPTEPL